MPGDDIDPVTMPMNFHQMAADGDRFMKELSVALGIPGDKNKTGRILRCVLHGIRGMITVEGSIQMIAQLPMFLKALYVDGWDGRHVKGIKHQHDLAELIRGLDRLGGKDLPTDDSVEFAVQAVFITLRRYLSVGELEKIAAQMPKQLKHLITAPIPIL